MVFDLERVGVNLVYRVLDITGSPLALQAQLAMHTATTATPFVAEWHIVNRRKWYQSKALGEEITMAGCTGKRSPCVGLFAVPRHRFLVLPVNLRPRAPHQSMRRGRFGGGRPARFGLSFVTRASSHTPPPCRSSSPFGSAYALFKGKVGVNEKN